MHNIMQLEHHSSLKRCNPGVARYGRSIDASQVAFVFAAIAFLALFWSFSMGSSPSSTLSARLLAIGSFVMTKKALLVLSNVIFLFLAADYCCFFTISASASDVAACEPGGALQHHQEEVQQCAMQSCVISYSASLHRKNSNISSQTFTEPVISDNTTAPEEQEEQDVPASSKMKLFVLDEEDSVTLETVVVEEPTCGTAQELEKLGIDELNKKFEEFIHSRSKWVKEEEAYLQRQEANL